MSPGRLVDLSRSRRVHIVGAGGAGMSAIATVLASMGHRVSGSDLKESPVLSRLRLLGVDVWVGSRPEALQGVEVLATSTAVPERDPEVAGAGQLGIEVLTRAAMLASIAAQRKVIAVSGTHGKTTTTSMLALILVEAGLRPSFMIGGDVNEIGTNALWDSGEWLVIEADESDGTFLEIATELAVVTNVEADHLDYYGGFDELVDAFSRFTTAARQVAVAGSDNEVAARLVSGTGGVTAGTSQGSTYQVVDLATSPDGSTFGVEHAGSRLASVKLAVPGVHNALNAVVAVAAASEIGVPPEAAESALARFAGVARRFEARGEARGVRFVDDYAHLPGEVSAVIEAARTWEPERLVVVFQPHRYTRTAALYESFADCFEGADALVVTEVYAAGEPPLPGIGGHLVADTVSRAHPDMPVTFVPGRADVARVVGQMLRPGDLCLSLGAGDLTTLADEVISSW